MRERLAEVTGRDVSRETLDKLASYEQFVRAEATSQNLVSSATLENFFERHIIDSAQLTRFEPLTGSNWVDVGSGAGLPGIVIACLVEGPVTLIEPRRLRAEFLARVVSALDLRATVICSRAESARGKYDVITARAVAALPQLLRTTIHFSTGNSLWVLPKGRNAAAELAETRRTWQGVFHVEQSFSDPNSGIVLASGVSKR